MSKLNFWKTQVTRFSILAVFRWIWLNAELPGPGWGQFSALTCGCYMSRSAMVVHHRRRWTMPAGGPSRRSPQDCLSVGLWTVFRQSKCHVYLLSLPPQAGLSFIFWGSLLLSLHLPRDGTYSPLMVWKLFWLCDNVWKSFRLKLPTLEASSYTFPCWCWKWWNNY